MTTQQLYEKLKGHLAVMACPRYDILMPFRPREFSMGDGLLVLRWCPRLPEHAWRPTLAEFCKAYGLTT